ncbi:hypothetical protein Tco_1358771 [Tanacetum coccineum]
MSISLLPFGKAMKHFWVFTLTLLCLLFASFSVFGHENVTAGDAVAPTVNLFKKLLFSSNEVVQTASSLAISSRLLQVPFPKQTMLGADDSVDSATSAPARADVASSAGGNARIMVEEDSITSSVQYCCDGCSTVLTYN